MLDVTHIYLLLLLPGVTFDTPELTPKLPQEHAKEARTDELQAYSKQKHPLSSTRFLLLLLPDVMVRYEGKGDGSHILLFTLREMLPPEAVEACLFSVFLRPFTI